MESKPATKPSRCYELFNALADSDGAGKALKSSEPGIAILDSDPDIKAGVVMVCIEQMQSPNFIYSFSRSYTVRTICGRLLSEPLPFSQEDVLRLLEFACSLDPGRLQNPTVQNIVDAAEHYISHNEVDHQVQAGLEELAQALGRRANNAEIRKLLRGISMLSTGSGKSKVVIVPKEAWSDVA